MDIITLLRFAGIAFLAMSLPGLTRADTWESASPPGLMAETDAH